MQGFQLSEVLQRDTIEVTRLSLCRVLLMNDARFPWLILVPELPNARELHDLGEPHQAMAWSEVSRSAIALERYANAYKMNIAALGNQVEQLHIHVIARKKEDEAWPMPAWGVGSPQPYSTDQAQEVVRTLRAELGRVAAP